MSSEYRESFTPQSKVFFVWLFLESTVLLSALLSNAVYLIIRSFKRQQVELDLKERTCHVESDILEARQIELGYINSWLAPFFTCLLIRYVISFPFAQSFEPHLESFTPMVNKLILLFAVQFVVGSSLFFVHSFEGAECNKNWWIKCGPYFAILFAIIAFILVLIMIFKLHSNYLEANMQTVLSPVIVFFEVNGVLNFFVYTAGLQGPSVLS